MASQQLHQKSGPQSYGESAMMTRFVERARPIARLFDRIRDVLLFARRLRLPPRVVTSLIGLDIVGIGFEALGIALLLPIIELLRTGHAVSSLEPAGRHWDVIRQIAGHIGIPVTLGLLLAVSFSALLLRQTFSYAKVTYESVTKRSSATGVRQQVFHDFLKAHTSTQDEIKVGEFANDLTMELARANGALFTLVETVGVAVQMLIYMAGLFILAPAMTALCIVLFALMSFLGRGLMTGVRRTGAAITEANAELNAFLVERLQRARLIRLSGTENAESSAFAALTGRQMDEQVRQSIVTARFSLLPEPAVIGFGYLVLYWGNQFFGLSFASLGLFVIILIRLMPVVKVAIADYNKIAGNWASVEKINRRLKDIADRREPPGGTKIFERLDECITYQNVSFTYGGSSAPALFNISVNLPAHRISALVGPSGAGKSTFVDLLPRLRDPSAGQILFDGKPIAEFSLASLRAGMAFVPQQPQIFNVTAAEHIRYGKEDATDEEIREAARLAGALAFIERLPQGFDTLLGNDGNRLSGGQRQRLDIARAMVRQASILILDEPTSALDAEAELAFRDVLRTLRAQTRFTVIVIAHRLSTIADADHIVVLKEGRLDAGGTHDELMAAGRWYADAYRSQFSATTEMFFAQPQLEAGG